MLLTILVVLFGIGLVVTGLVYQLEYIKMKSDPLLITACYVWGGFNIAMGTFGVV